MMRSFYIKRLGFQELGSPKPDRTTSRGRYIYISKDCAGFFPHLSRLQNNDTVLIPIVMPFSDAKIYSRLVYHNDKYNVIGGTRDEYRLYLNKELDINKTYFKVDDIVVFEKMEQVIDGNTIPLYFAHTFNVTDSCYGFLNQVVETSDIRGNHALFTGNLDFIPFPTVSEEERPVVIPVDVREEVIEVQSQIIAEPTGISIEESRGASLFNSVSFRDFVLLGYGHKCAITGKSIIWNNLNNLEAAHIQPRAHSGTFLPCNGIALSRDMHWAFDKGFISISNEFIVIVHDEVKNSMLQEYADQKIIIPADPFFQPEKKYLEYHRTNIYGLFLRSGSIRGVLE
jgi:hypothetical protein